MIRLKLQFRNVSILFKQVFIAIHRKSFESVLANVFVSILFKQVFIAIQEILGMFSVLVFLFQSFLNKSL